MNKYLNKNISVAPLVVFRILFGALTSYAWFWSVFKDDIATRYTQPLFFFKYYGFDWVLYPSDAGIYALYCLWIIGSIGIFFGAFYRFSILLFMFSFGYLQLIDASNYINHYYALLIFSFCLLWIPAHTRFSVDVWRKPSLKTLQAPVLYLYVLRVQIAIIYTFAALAKLNSDWLLSAMPLKIWLLQQHDFPFVGFLFRYHSVHLLASWAAFIFDLCIVWCLLYSKTRIFAYIAVLLFHSLTGLLFNIGLFPLLMIVCTTLFFSPSFFERCLLTIDKTTLAASSSARQSTTVPRALKCLFLVHVLIQLLLPLRHAFLYNDHILWTENGYRFSWRVMLVEKEGYATFYVKDSQSNRTWQVDNSTYLTPFQEKRMAIRPYHLVQFGQFIGKEFTQKYKIEQVKVVVDVAVSLNARVSQSLMNPETDLMLKTLNYTDTNFILPLKSY